MREKGEGGRKKEGERRAGKGRKERRGARKEKRRERKEGGGGRKLEGEGRKVPPCPPPQKISGYTNLIKKTRDKMRCRS